MIAFNVSKLGTFILYDLTKSLKFVIMIRVFIKNLKLIFDMEVFAV